MSRSNPICRVCGAKLNDDNWHASRRKRGDYICKGCRRELDKQRRRYDPEVARRWREANPGCRSDAEASRRWRQANPEKSKASYTESKRKRGVRPFNENKECSQFLGCHVAERVLSYVFNDVERMPMNNPGFDFVCSHGKMIDVKSACLTGTKYPYWHFRIKRNATADYFLCLAFDNREELTPLHVWLIPGSKLSHLTATSISPSTIHKWDAYRLDVSKVNDCCDTMRKHVGGWNEELENK